MKTILSHCMKRGLCALVLTLLCLSALAQDVVMATLQHGDDLQVFHGASAFKQAVEAAQKGDVVTLSPGAFNSSVTIDKVLTIQGAGYRETYTSEGVVIDLPEGEDGLLVEGIRFNGKVTVRGYAKSMTFKRCWFSDSYNFNSNYTSIIFETAASEVLIQECRMAHFYGYANQNIGIFNSVVLNLSCDSNSSVLVEHCVIDVLGEWPVVYYSIVFRPHNNQNAAPLYYSIYANETSCRKVGCWRVGYNSNYNWYNSPFISDSNSYNMSIGNSYTLTDEAAATYLDNYGTQVGLYGGTLGFTETPSNPQITEADIPRQVDDNGQLHVRFKVEAQQ